MRTTGSHRQYRHPESPSVVTAAGHLNDDIGIGTLKSILRKVEPKK